MSIPKSQKLELTWIGKGDEPKLEPRILIENPEYSYGDPKSENMLIHGDNLLALKALEQDYAGKVKCIYIDPPYNTGNAFEHYDDGVEHSEWLNLITPRLRLLRDLLSSEGSIWISIDDDESHYLKVLCDEIFGRQNFVSNVIWEKKYSPQNDAKWLSDSHDHILVYAKNKDIWRPNLLPRSDEMNARYKNPDHDSRGPWKSGDVLVKSFSKSGVFAVINPTTKEEFWPQEGSCYRFNKDSFGALIKDNRVYFGKDGKSGPQVKRFLSEVKQGSVSKTIWHRTEVSDNQDAKKEVRAFNSKNVFATPKPEKLLERILYLGSKEGDLILDSFLGSGTTAAVAHKMGRRYIGIELGEHAITHCYPRLKQVVDGEQGGISKSVDWKGGGGFKFYTLAPSLLNMDKFGNWVINKEYNPDMLAAAMAKQEGFKYAPDEAIFWKQGRSMERDFLFTTTQFLTVEALDRIQEEMKPEETLLICCKAYQPECENRHTSITIKKIPSLLLDKCEFGRDDYSLKIVQVPTEDQEGEGDSEEVGSDFNSEAPTKIKSSKPTQPGLFD
jgi:adenine-specific DNA-methyltransferase